MKKMAIFMAAVAMMFATMFGAAPVFAETNEMNKEICESGMDAALKEAAGCNTTKSAVQIGSILVEVAIAAAGIIAVLVIVVSGQRMISAAGDAARVAAAKNMLIYAVIGLIIAMLSFGIVAFVSEAFPNGANSAGVVVRK